MNLAALQALLNNNLENAIVAATPGGIEAQKAQGQVDFCANSTLPIKCNYCKREELESMGVVFGKQVDDLFIEAQLPDGWRKESTDHSMWSNLLDEKGRKRATIFYKAAFYDRDAFINTCRRYSASNQPVGGWTDNCRSSQWEGVATDHDGTVLWRTEPLYTEPDHNDREAWRKWYDAKNELAKQAAAWLDKNKPGWCDTSAYWD